MQLQFKKKVDQLSEVRKAILSDEEVRREL